MPFDESVPDRNDGDHDRLIRLNDVPKIPWLPRRRGGARLAIATVHRWCTAGVGGCRLRHVRAGGVRCTTDAWLRQFFESLAGRHAGVVDVDTPAAIEGAATQQRRAAAAERRLAAEGFISPTPRR